jgi:predicted aspartyl protease
MSKLRRIAALALAITSTCSLVAESHCPGNVPSLPYRLIKGHLIVTEISINGSGPYDFLLDTGSHYTMVDPSLAKRMHLALETQVEIATLGAQGTFALVDVPRIDAGNHVLMHQDAVVYNLKNLPTAIRLDGILGESFLSHFDLLIDNEHHLLCLDETGTMRPEPKGVRLPFLASDGTTVTSSIVVEANLSGVAKPVRLKLDSGANQSVLFRAPAYMPFRGTPGAGAEGAAQIFSRLPQQNLKIGNLQLKDIDMVTFAKNAHTGLTSDCDGLLSTGLFRRILIEHSEHVLVLEAW